MSWRPVLLTTSTVGDTQALAAALAEVTQPGDVLVLSGEMGTGKTAFTQGFARGLGIVEAVTSPTFTIVREYGGGRLALHHLDVYRLDHLHEVAELGLGEMLDEDAVMVVEWGDAVLPVLGDTYLQVRLAFGAGDDTRRLELHGCGGPWLARQRGIDEAVASWAAGRAAGGGVDAGGAGASC